MFPRNIQIVLKAIRDVLFHSCKSCKLSSKCFIFCVVMTLLQA